MNNLNDKSDFISDKTEVVRLNEEIKQLGRFILEETDVEPASNETIIDTAIRVMREFKERLDSIDEQREVITKQVEENMKLVEELQKRSNK